MGLDLDPMLKSLHRGLNGGGGDRGLNGGGGRGIKTSGPPPPPLPAVCRG